MSEKKMTKRITSVFLAFILLLSLAAVAQAPAPSKADIDKRVESILSRMTLEEKTDYIGGINSLFIRAIPRLGVPELKMSDGPMGVRSYGPSTAFPAGIAMAASWDTALVKQIGAMMGRDARARGVHFLLGPGMNIYRSPMNGRNFEYFGEDPFLASRMAVADIEGIQSQGVIATAKHFVANNEEWDRNRISSDVDERTLREIYLPAFEASVREAHVGAIMDSYNLVNGVHSTQNSFLNTQVLRKDWGFTGIVMSDWEATYDGVAAANGGLDLEMPSGKYMNRETLIPAIKAGKVPEAVIDEKVRRILRTAMEFGFFDRPQTDSSISVFNQQARQVALDAALGSMVLLKNNGILPFNASKLKTVAVIGPDAYPAVTGGGGSSMVTPLMSVSFLEGISNYLVGRANVTYTSGVPRFAETFDKTEFTLNPDGGPSGMRAEYFNNMNLEGTPAVVRTDRYINFNFGHASYVTNGPAEKYSARWTGYYRPSATTDYRFYVNGDDGYRLFVDDKPVVERWQDQGETLETRDMKLEVGKTYKIRLEYYQDDGEASIGFGIGPATDPALQEARDMATKADAVILCVGFSPATESEGFDRTFTLPGIQEQLIKEVLSANKNVVIVLTAGGNVDMNNWIDSTPALLHAWYPGQEGGTALAKLLFGDISPSGKLPASFERRIEDSPTFHTYYDPNIGPGQGGDAPRTDGTARGKVEYKEGIFLGYRFFDKAGIKPLFPFGYGLSYTKFKYSNLKISPSSFKGEEPVTVTFSITNAGKREGAEVAEVYVSDKHSMVERPAKELKGFTKVNLKPGETKTVSVPLNRRAFSYYDVEGKQWKAEPGEFTVLVGSSSAETALTGTVVLAK